MIAESSTERVKYPTWSSEFANENKPNLEILPQVGLIPTNPLNYSGFLTESPVSLPIENGAIHDETPAALPQLEPPHNLSFLES